HAGRAAAPRDGAAVGVPGKAVHHVVAVGQDEDAIEFLTEDVADADVIAGAGADEAVGGGGGADDAGGAAAPAHRAAGPVPVGAVRDVVPVGQRNRDSYAVARRGSDEAVGGRDRAGDALSAVAPGQRAQGRPARRAAAPRAALHDVVAVRQRDRLEAHGIV